MSCEFSREDYGDSREEYVAESRTEVSKEHLAQLDLVGTRVFRRADTRAEQSGVFSSLKVKEPPATWGITSWKAYAK